MGFISIAVKRALAVEPLMSLKGGVGVPRQGTQPTHPEASQRWLDARL
jgi:hypothetical protein